MRPAPRGSSRRWHLKLDRLSPAAALAIGWLVHIATHLPTLVRTLGLLAALLLGGCSDPGDRLEFPASESATIYNGAWEYRYGESPASADGLPEWAEPGHDDGSWHRAATLNSPPGRPRSQPLWLRTHLPSGGPPLRDAVLFVEEIVQCYDAYLDGKLIARFGRREGGGTRFPGRRQHHLRLGEQYAGKMLTLRITSPLGVIGIRGPLRIGGRAEMVVDVARRGLAPLIVGAVLLALSLGALTLYWVQRGELSYLLYALLSLVMGIYMICRSPARSLLFEEPTLWYYLELSSLCLTGAAASAFMIRILGRGPLGILQWLGYAFLALFAVAVLLLVGDVVMLPALLRPLQYLWLLAALGMVVTASQQSWRGDADARIFGVGMLAAGLITLYELMQALGVLPRSAFVAHYSAVAFMLALALILARRVRAVHKRLSDFSTMLHLTYSSAEELQPGQHTQIALEELLRMLSAERALLFLCRPGIAPEQLELAAGRDARGSEVNELPPPADHDGSLVESVFTKRRPVVREFRPTTVSSYGASTERSVMAAPLLARGQLLGVLYLEADATRHTFGSEDVNILLSLGSQVALTLLAARAFRPGMPGSTSSLSSLH